MLSSRVRAEIFRLLFDGSDKELHVREIERQSGFNVRTVRQELDKLTRLDLVKKRTDGNRSYHRANKVHPLYSEIQSLVLKTLGLVDVLREPLDDPSVSIAFVFGSVARGEEMAGSDVDLMVIGKLSLRKLSGMLSGVPERIGREINPHVFSEKEFNDRLHSKDHFIRSVVDSPKLFIVGTEDDLRTVGKQ